MVAAEEDRLAISGSCDPEQQATEFDKQAFWITNSICVFMIILTIYLTYKVFKITEFYWVKRMFVLCVVQNFTAFYLSFG